MFYLRVREGSDGIFVGLWVNLKDIFGFGCCVKVIDLPCPAVPSYRKSRLHVRTFSIVIV